MCVLTRGVGQRIRWCIAMDRAALSPYIKVRYQIKARRYIYFDKMSYVSYGSMILFFFYIFQLATVSLRYQLDLGIVENVNRRSEAHEW